MIGLAKIIQVINLLLEVVLSAHVIAGVALVIGVSMLAFMVIKFVLRRFIQA